MIGEQRVSFRLTPHLAGVLDGYVRARGLPDRSHGLRLLIREAAMSPAERDALPDDEELLRLLGDLARACNVQAIRLLLEEYRRRDGEPRAPRRLSIIDELAARGRGDRS